MSLILVRHGNTDWNDAGIELIRGRKDIPLNEHGKRIIQETAQKIAARNKPIAYVISDELSRCVDTAKCIAQHCKTVSMIDHNMGPWDIGHLAGQLKAEVLPTIESLVKNPDNPLDGGENYNQFYTRWSYQFRRLREQAQNGKDIVVVVHSSNFHSLPSILAGKEPDYTDNMQPQPGEIMVID